MQVYLVSVWQRAVSGLKEKWEFFELLHTCFPMRQTESAQPIFFQIRGFETAYCIDSMGHTNGGFVELGPCHRMGGNQVSGSEASMKEKYLH